MLRSQCRNISIKLETERASKRKPFFNIFKGKTKNKRREDNSIKKVNHLQNKKNMY